MSINRSYLDNDGLVNSLSLRGPGHVTYLRFRHMPLCHTYEVATLRHTPDDSTGATAGLNINRTDLATTEATQSERGSLRLRRQLITRRCTMTLGRPCPERLVQHAHLQPISELHCMQHTDYWETAPFTLPNLTLLGNLAAFLCIAGRRLTIDLPAICSDPPMTRSSFQVTCISLQRPSEYLQQPSKVLHQLVRYI